MVQNAKNDQYLIGREHLVSFYYCYIQILVLGAQGIRATGFKRAQGNVHCAKFENHTNRVTFETNAIRMTSSIQALCISKRLDLHCFSFLYQLKYSEHFISYQYMFANAVSVESNRSTTMYLYCQTRTYIGTYLLFYVIVTCDI